MGLTYMQRRSSGIYEFRQHLPQKLAGKPVPAHMQAHVSELINPKTGLFKRELTKSLQTADYKTARRKDLREASRIEALFSFALELVARGDAGSPPKTPLPSLTEIENDAAREILAEDEQARRDGDARKQLQTAAERAQWPDLEPIRLGTRGMEESHVLAMEEEIDLLLGDFHRAYSRRDPSIIQVELHSYLTARNAPIDPQSDEYYEAGLAYLKGRVRGYQMRKQRNAGEEVSLPPPLILSVKGLTLSEAFTEWKAGSSARGGKKASATSIVEAERAVRYFTQWHGDLHLADITKEKAREFRNALGQFPKKITNKQRALPLRRLLKETAEAGETIHATSVNKYLVLLGGIVSAAEREGKMDHVPSYKNPFHGLAITVDRRNDATRREPFANDQLSALFSSGVSDADCLTLADYYSSDTSLAFKPVSKKTLPGWLVASWEAPRRGPDDYMFWSASSEETSGEAD